jgi:Leucine-rich repeat (LRR) protein
MAQLRDLDLRNTHISNAAAVHLTKLRRLESFILAGTFVDSQVLSSLATLVELRNLDLASTNIESDLHYLGSLTKLESLNLSKTLIDDPALRGLPSLPNLRTIDVSMSRVTEEFVDTLGTSTLSIEWFDEEIDCAH